MKVQSQVWDSYSVRSITGAKAGRSPEKVSAETSPAEESSTPAATVSISDTARQLASAVAAPVDTQKIEALKNQIASGDYKVDSKLVASKILDRLA